MVEKMCFHDVSNIASVLSLYVLILAIFLVDISLIFNFKLSVACVISDVLVLLYVLVT
jgi:hypothetical protein